MTDKNPMLDNPDFKEYISNIKSITDPTLFEMLDFRDLYQDFIDRKRLDQLQDQEDQ